MATWTPTEWASLITVVSAAAVLVLKNRVPKSVYFVEQVLRDPSFSKKFERTNYTPTVHPLASSRAPSSARFFCVTLYHSVAEGSLSLRLCDYSHTAEA